MKLQLGSTGDLVETLQRRLKVLGFDPGEIDGSFGPQTERALKAFQKQKRLTVDGAIGTQTAAKLNIDGILVIPDLERRQYKPLLMINPNYFGNFPKTAFNAVKKIAHNTKYEEITCVGFNTGRNTLETTVQTKLPYGYGGNLCTDGTIEYVRFFLNYGDGWENAGLVGFTAHDLPDTIACAGKPTKPLAYAVTQPVEPRRKICDQPVLPKVRSILSWKTMPPEDDMEQCRTEVPLRRAGYRPWAVSGRTQVSHLRAALWWQRLDGSDQSHSGGGHRWPRQLALRRPGHRLFRLPGCIREPVESTGKLVHRGQCGSVADTSGDGRGRPWWNRNGDRHQPLVPHPSGQHQTGGGHGYRWRCLRPGWFRNSHHRNLCGARPPFRSFQVGHPAPQLGSPHPNKMVAGSSVGSMGNDPTPSATKDDWRLDTSTMAPCGYVVRLRVWDRTIVSSRPANHNRATDDETFCLLDAVS